MSGVKESFTCVFCCRGFARSDALKRHWTTCRVRKDRALEVPTIASRVRGRRLRACDRCSKRKRACSSTEPCTACVSNGQSCTYSRPHHHAEKAAGTADSQQGQTVPSNFDLSVYENAFDELGDEADTSIVDVLPGDESLELDSALECTSDSTPRPAVWDKTWPLLPEHALAVSVLRRPTQLDMDTLMQFPFLENFSRVTGFVKSFECGTAERRLSATSSHMSQRHLLSRMTNDPYSHWMEITQAALTLIGSQDDPDRSTCISMDQTHQIVSYIREVTLDKPYHNSSEITWSNSLESLCYEFFHPDTVQKYLSLFWSCWYPNWPTIHRPTHDAAQKSPKLAAAMAVVGACLSPNERDRVTAQVWFNAIEDTVFGDSIFFEQNLSDVWEQRNEMHRQRMQLEILQAAYCVCLYQTWEGSRKSKRRILRQRFSDIVYFSRDIGLSQASLRGVDTSNLAAFDWEEYIMRESLIRIFSYVSNIDASYALFFRHPPRMVSSELDVDLSSPETCFQAESREECFIELKLWRSNTDATNGTMTIASIVDAFVDGEATTTSRMRHIISHLSVFNMFTIVHALYLQVYRLETSGIHTSGNDIERISSALDRWRELWPSSSRDAELMTLANQDRDTTDLWRSVGFIRHAPEYWLLAYLTLKKISSRAKTHRGQVCVRAAAREDDDMLETKALIAHFKTAKAGLCVTVAGSK